MNNKKASSKGAFFVIRSFETNEQEIAPTSRVRLAFKRLLRLKLATADKASVTCFVIFLAIAYRSFRKKQNIAICGKNDILRSFLSSRLRHLCKKSELLIPIKKDTSTVPFFIGRNERIDVVSLRRTGVHSLTLTAILTSGFRW